MHIDTVIESPFPQYEAEAGVWNTERTSQNQGEWLAAESIRYDTIRQKSLMWTQKLSDQLSLALVARKMYKRKKLKRTNAGAH